MHGGQHVEARTHVVKAMLVLSVHAYSVRSSVTLEILNTPQRRQSLTRSLVLTPDSLGFALANVERATVRYCPT